MLLLHSLLCWLLLLGCVLAISIDDTDKALDAGDAPKQLNTEADGSDGIGYGDYGSGGDSAADSDGDTAGACFDFSTEDSVSGGSSTSCTSCTGSLQTQCTSIHTCATGFNTYATGSGCCDSEELNTYGPKNTGSCKKLRANTANIKKICNGYSAEWVTAKFVCKSSCNSCSIPDWTEDNDWIAKGNDWIPVHYWIVDGTDQIPVTNCVETGNTAADCLDSCAVATATVTYPAANNGTACAGDYTCTNGDGACGEPSPCKNIKSKKKLTWCEKCQDLLAREEVELENCGETCADDVEPRKKEKCTEKCARRVELAVKKAKNLAKHKERCKQFAA